MEFTPLTDRVVVKAMKAEETTKSGIILTSSARETPAIAEVISVGPGGMVNGREVTMVLKPGDKVITDKYAGSTIKIGDEEFIVIRQDDVLVIVN